MALFRDRIRPALYDFFGRRLEKAFGEHRRKALAAAQGHVLEIGGGTGLNLPHYPAGIEELVVTEPAPGMLRRAKRRATAARPVTFVQAAAESLPFASGSFDTVVSTLVLCSVEDVDRALAEIHRVLRPGGQLLFVEHVRSDDPRTAKWQDRLERPWQLLADGCHPNRATLARIEAGPFEVVELERGELPKSPSLVRPLIAGRAIARSAVGANLGYHRRVLAKAVVSGLSALALVPSGATVAPPSQPGPWRQVGKAATSRIGARLHLSRTAIDMKALAFVVASRSSRRIHVTWASYCEFMSDDDYTESYSGKLSGVQRITYYPHVFDGATNCDVAVNAAAIKGARVVAAVFSY